MFKRLIAVLLCFCILLQSVGTNVAHAEEANEITIEYEESIDSKNLNISSVVVANRKTVNDIIAQSKFTARQGQGFAAERGNNLIDRIKRTNAIVVGDNNVKNGPDRLIINRSGNNILIQDKYCNTAQASIEACFEKGIFRYVDGDGNPMQIEVPADQYDDAVALMRTKILEGKINGITDPEDAETIVRKGSLTYKQAANLAKAGTVESLKYDAANGVVSSVAAFGISTTVNFTVRTLNGETFDNALRDSAIEGLKTGGMQFVAAVIAGQLAKTGAKKVFEPSAKALVNAFGDDFATAVVQAFGDDAARAALRSVEKNVVEEGAESVAKASTKKIATKVLGTNLLVDTVILVVFTIPDAIDVFSGRISSKQFAKNLAVAVIGLAGGVGGAIGGAALGSAIAPGAGTTIGAIIGGIGGDVTLSVLADMVADLVVKDDAEEMYEIIKEVFVQDCEDYIATETEAQSIADQLNTILTEDALKDMYQSEDKQQFAEDMLAPLFEQEAAKRPVIIEPTTEEMREALKEELRDVVFIH